jgi:hypothetical protein
MFLATFEMHSRSSSKKQDLAWEYGMDLDELNLN